ncbi:MAG: hypothetical protein A2252_00670 [Elusimicrobia bacterium RIFOXYA2_FULL_39_19]|nr:MAG: hypothetical protein A2252_00670 [Elusimicrobia bacterium RIFOXYA2_FULL_39_19]
MDTKVLQIRKYKSKGFRPLIDFENWRVAMLNPCKDVSYGTLKALERHMKTDEVFVLLSGKAVLLCGGGDKVPAEDLNPVVMKPKTVYNFPKACWHSIIMKKRAKILIVENTGTGQNNTEYSKFTENQIGKLQRFRNYK